LFTIFLIASTNVTSDRATAVWVTEIFCYRYSTIDNFAKNNIFQEIKCSLQQFIGDTVYEILFRFVQI